MTKEWKEASELAKQMYEEEYGPDTWEDADKYEREDYQFAAYEKLQKEKNKQDTWYAVETVFIDGKYFDSKCCFKVGDTSPVGHCYAPLTDEPLNRCEKKFDGRIEIHTDWFESEVLAKDFCEGNITYVHHYQTYYKKSNKSTFNRFLKREIVLVDASIGIPPHKGLHIMHSTEDES